MKNFSKIIILLLVIFMISVFAFGWIPQEGDSPSWPEKTKETGGFVAGNPTGTASPWHTTLLAKSSVLYAISALL